MIVSNSPHITAFPHFCIYMYAHVNYSVQCAYVYTGLCRICLRTNIETALEPGCSIKDIEEIMIFKLLGSQSFKRVFFLPSEKGNLLPRGVFFFFHF